MCTWHTYFCAIANNRTKSVNSEKKLQQPNLEIFAKFTSISSFKISIFHTKFSTIPCNNIRNKTIKSTSEKTE